MTLTWHLNEIIIFCEHANSKIVHDTNNVTLAFVVVIVDGGNLIGGTVRVVDVGHSIQ